MKIAAGLSLALALALAIAMLAGAGSAPATALCIEEVKEEWCKSAFPGETTFVAEATSATFETNLGSMTCAKSILEGKTSEEATGKGVALNTKVTALTFGGCTLSKTECTLTAVNAPYSSPISSTEGQKGTLTLKKGELGTPGVKVKCGLLANCTVSGEPVLDLNGGIKGKATLVASKEKLSPGEGTCFKEISWTSTYTFSSPNGGELFVGPQARVIKLCKKQESPCSPAETYGAGTPLEAQLESSPPEATIRVKVTDEETGEEVTYNTTCKKTPIKGTTEPTMGRTAPIKITELKFEECGSTCSVKAYSLPYVGQIDGSMTGDGTLSMWSQVTNLEIEIKCLGAYTCVYKAPFLGGLNKMKLTGGAPAKLKVTQDVGTLVNEKSSVTCGEKLEWEGAYKFTKPENLGAAKMWAME